MSSEVSKPVYRARRTHKLSLPSWLDQSKTLNPWWTWRDSNLERKIASKSYCELAYLNSECEGTYKWCEQGMNRSYDVLAHFWIVIPDVGPHECWPEKERIIAAKKIRGLDRRPSRIVDLRIQLVSWWYLIMQNECTRESSLSNLARKYQPPSLQNGGMETYDANHS